MFHVLFTLVIQHTWENKIRYSNLDRLEGQGKANKWIHVGILYRTKHFNNLSYGKQDIHVANNHDNKNHQVETLWIALTASHFPMGTILMTHLHEQKEHHLLQGHYALLQKDRWSTGLQEKPKKKKDKSKKRENFFDLKVIF